MKLKLSLAIAFLSISSISFAQNLKFSELNQLLNSQPMSDMLLMGKSFTRVKVAYLSAGLLLTTYQSPHKDYIVEMGSSTTFLQCMIYIKNESYTNQIISEAEADNFIIDESDKEALLFRKPYYVLRIQVDKKNGLYKIGLQRSL